MSAIKLLISRGQDLVRNAQDLEREIMLLRGLEVGVLKLGSGPYPLEVSMGPTLARMMVKHPGLKIERDTPEWKTLPQCPRDRLADRCHFN